MRHVLDTKSVRSGFLLAAAGVLLATVAIACAPTVPVTPTARPGSSVAGASSKPSDVRTARLEKTGSDGDMTTYRLSEYENGVLYRVCYIARQPSNVDLQCP